MEGICVAGTHGKNHYIKYDGSSDEAVHRLVVMPFLVELHVIMRPIFLHDDASSYVVMEADEFDRSFLQLTPHLALISAMDADHLDIYGEASKVYEAFNQFVQLINPGGALLFKEGLPVELPDEDVEVFTYSAKEEGDFYPFNLKQVDGLYQFNLKDSIWEDNEIENGSSWFGECRKCCGGDRSGFVSWC